MTNPADLYDSNSTETMIGHEPRTTAYPLSREMKSSPNANDQDTETSCSQTSRRKSLAKLQSKVRRLSHLISTAPVVPMDSRTAPLPQLDHDLNQNSPSKTTPLPLAESEMTSANAEDNAQDPSLMQAEQVSDAVTATPFNLKTKQLISALAVGSFRPKLPQRNNPEDSIMVATVGESTKTTSVDVTSHFDDDDDISDIYDEELGSYEDVSETLDARSPEKIFTKESPPQELNKFEPLEDDVFEEEFISSMSRQKRPLPEDEDSKEGEKRRKTSAEFVEEAFQASVAECDGNIATARLTARTIDSSDNSHTASRCEAAFESTVKNSLFESQLEDYASDAQKKLEDGDITVLEFFKLFNIDFVIHNPRQSVNPGRLLSETEVTALDLLKDKHISRPKLLVYEADIQTLTEKVEGLKVRLPDLNKPLKTLNRPLWEQMRYSSEKELKSFGTKLKERNNFFRKTSKVQSHEIKEVLYTNLVRANLEEQRKLKGMIEGAEETLKSLDGCIGELEAELVAVNEKGSEDKPSLKSLQEEMKKVTESLADNEKQIAELELQKQQNSSKLNRLKAETRNLESHVSLLNTLNEWRLRETRNNCTVYTFLHETILLQLMQEQSSGNDTDGGSELKITSITFKLELDDEKSHAHARLVHKLIGQYVEEEPAWLEKYPTSAHIPKLLHDVSLVVSSCRLLGEELRLLKMWGGLRLDILDISCKDTRVNIVFSSLKKLSKFEVVFAVTLTNHLCVLQLESFKNMIGSTTIQQIEEIVASFSPSRNLLTKIVKKIHDALLC
ncbi:outer kinetochore KNL1 complex subunit KNL1 [Xenentodon cancila]